MNDINPKIKKRKEHQIKTPQIKVCGLTVARQARACAESGADAIGLIFFPPSPRHVSFDQAAAICAALPPHVISVGVFVNPAWDILETAVQHCGVKAIQLHGAETPQLVDKITKKLKIKVIKALFSAKQPDMTRAKHYNPWAFLVECGQGKLPGGNAQTWDWAQAKPLIETDPVILAGGLASGNVYHAIDSCLPDAVDASSGLEAVPGQKDLHKVEQFIDAVKQSAPLYAKAQSLIRKIF
ncbi:MAG: phosphoribosylanthranilate isomerase [Desulfobacteraceae bacterium]|nr:phosphoribosylanthranilate isomerase [Desulfobacteraceae bacterium]